jgi:ectoine hydroxylase-related dioxygenase (phytanoyl-CoA dioxygenase family)
MTHDKLAVHTKAHPDLRATFDRDGVVLVRDLLTPEEVLELRQNIHRYEKWMLPAVPEDWSRRESDGSIRGMYYLERVDPFFETFTQRADLPLLVEQVTGHAATFASMETFHKQPKVGGPSKVHQDGFYYVGSEITGVNVWIALDDADEENAALKYWPGSHRRGLLPHGGVEGDPYFRALTEGQLEEFGAPAWAVLPSGSGAMHSDTIVHGSDPNRSDQPRLAVALTYTLDVSVPRVVEQER